MGYPHEIYGEGTDGGWYHAVYCTSVYTTYMLLLVLHAGVYAFVILKSWVNDSHTEIVEGLKELVKKKIAAFAIPTAFLVRIQHQCSTQCDMYIVSVQYHYTHTCVLL